MGLEIRTLGMSHIVLVFFNFDGVVSPGKPHVMNMGWLLRRHGRRRMAASWIRLSIHA
jgi:hypothetical protein